MFVLKKKIPNSYGLFRGEIWNQTGPKGHAGEGEAPCLPRWGRAGGHLQMMPRCPLKAREAQHASRGRTHRRAHVRALQAATLRVQGAAGSVRPIRCRPLPGSVADPGFGVKTSAPGLPESGGQTPNCVTLDCTSRCRFEYLLFCRCSL